jgi:hypothetical protein
VEENLNTIEQDMKNSLKAKKTNGSRDTDQKRQPLSVSAARTVSKQHQTYTIKFD